MESGANRFAINRFPQVSQKTSGGLVDFLLRQGDVYFLGNSGGRDFIGLREAKHD